MTLLTDFKRGANPIWYLVDLVGAQFDDNFWLYVLENEIPYNFAPVYHDVSGTIPWTNPIQFLPNGTLPVDIFFDTSKVYRLEFRQNLGLLPPSQSDPLRYEVNDYVPTGDGGITPTGAGVITQNLITNPQFSLVNFGEPIVLVAVNPDPIEVAPGWFLEFTGVGSATITRVPLDTTLSNPTNAPYALNINSNGWSAPPVLRQRFADNGMNWQNKTVAASITARIDAVPQSIMSILTASNGQPLGGVLINTVLTNDFVEYQGHVTIPTFANLDVPPDAYIDYTITLPQVGSVYLTSIQITESQTDTDVEYYQDTVNRQIDHTFNYFKPKLEYKPIPSYLVGWDFPKNPAQPLGDGLAATTFATGANTGFYAWDQTIIFQTVTSSVGFSRATNGGLELTCQAPGQIALIQYLDQIEARKILSDRASVNISASTTHANGLRGTVSLWACTTGGGNLPTLPTTAISALSATAVPTMGNGTWTEVPNIFYNKAFTLEAASATNSEDADIMLNGWDMAGAVPTDTALFFAIVVAFEPWIAADVITVNSISLCPGDIATRPAPKTTSETTFDCQKYYWKTFLPGIVPAQNAGLGTGEFYYLSTQAGVLANTSPNIFYPTPMRANPDIIFYNPSAANDQVTNVAQGTDGTGTAVLAGPQVTSSLNNLVFFCTGNAGWDTPRSLAVHITADARLGVVN